MADFTIEPHLADALGRLGEAKDERLRELTAAFTRHMFAFIEEVRPTEQEWLAGIEFLTAVGQECDDKRQEFILLSDMLGVTMLVDYLNHGSAPGVTETSVLGPFHREGAPKLDNGTTISQDGIGEPVVISGRVTDEAGAPITGAVLDVWQTAANGLYEVQDDSQPDYNLRGIFTTDGDGRYALRTVKPVSYPVPIDGPVGALMTALGRHSYRPAHVHFIVSAEGYKPVVTQLFTDDDPYLRSDAVFGVKGSLVVTYQRGAEEWRVTYDFGLERAA
ncbi:MAG: dioxygenase [Alphaproteobacteria bacterium]|jgi:catechol 1,2-dioxygenase|nr:dioxygenase [Alphaproteobacteria bacterium]